MDETPSEWIAYHEAGHAVMSCLLGGRVTMLTIVPQDDDRPKRWGEIEVHWPGHPPAAAQAMVALAGPAAELVYRQESLHPGLIPEFAEDWQLAWTATTSKDIDRVEQLRKLEIISKRLFRVFSRGDIWQATSELADLLLTHETLDEDEVHDAVLRWVEPYSV